MGLRSLKQTFDRMQNDIQGTDNNTSYNDLSDVKNKIDTMYKYRNDSIRDSDTNNSDSTPNQIQNICGQHYFKSFDEYQKSIGVSYSISVGDINNALDNMSFCTCNARAINSCNCVARATGDYCECNGRDAIVCTCVGRDPGKYTPECYCDTRNAGCNCVSRDSSYSCDCNGRCSCNMVNEYSMSAPIAPGNCTCVSRQLGDFCDCNNRIITPAGNCNCQQRTAECNGVSTAPNHWDGWCGNHMNPTTRGACLCNARIGSAEVEYCSCVSRTSSVSCSYNVVKYK